MTSAMAAAASRRGGGGSSNSTSTSSTSLAAMAGSAPTGGLPGVKSKDIMRIVLLVKREGPWRLLVGPWQIVYAGLAIACTRALFEGRGGCATLYERRFLINL